MVVVFGSINLDLVARVPSIPAPGETVAALGYKTYAGGKGANQALAARLAGAQVAMYGAVGHDAFTAPALANLAAAGVDLGGVMRVDAPTGVALINVDMRGENAITVVAGANALARAAQIPAEHLGAGCTLLMQLETSVGEVAALADRARRSGTRVLLNAAPGSPLPDTLLSNVDFLIVNETEAAAIAPGLSSEAFMRHVGGRFGATVVMTLGAAGAVMSCNGDVTRETPPSVDVIDTTGAGDSFAGTFAAALDRRAAVREALAAAVHAGARACTHEGAQSIPR